jgi:hypothetical protein
MSDDEENWSTVVNTKKIKSLEKRDEKRRARLEYEQLKREEELLAQGIILEESDEDTTPITIGADFNELVRVQEKKEKEESKKQAATKQANKQKKETTSAPKLQAARTLSAKVSTETWKSELQSFTKKFPTAQDIQLKYLADFFLETFNNCSEQRPTVKVLDKDVIATIQKWLSSFPQKELNQFIVFLIQHELESDQKNSPGIAILIDLFCVNYPDLLKNHKISALFKKKFGNGIPNKSYSFLHQLIWSAIHSTEPQIGLHFFMEYLTKNIAKGNNPHAEDIVKILESFKDIKLNNQFHSPIGLNNILQSCQNAQIAPELRTRIIQMIGPLLQILDQGEDKENSHEIFLLLLSFGLVSNNNKELPSFQTELFEQVLSYLARDQSEESLEEYIFILCDNYYDYTLQINNFNKYLVHNWQNSKFSPGLEKNKDKFTLFIKAIVDINDELSLDKVKMNERKLNASVLQVSSSTCEDLLRVIEGGSPTRSTTTKVARSSTSSVGFGRIVFTVALLAIIYYIFANDVQFTDIRDFVRSLRKQYNI